MFENYVIFGCFVLLVVSFMFSAYSAVKHGSCFFAFLAIVMLAGALIVGVDGLQRLGVLDKEFLCPVLKKL